MEIDKEHIRNCLLFEFDKGSNAATADRNIRQVYGEDAVDDSTCRRGFENSETETEAVKINHGLNVHQCLPKKILTKI